MSPAAFAAFVGASGLLAVTPGQGVVYIVSRTLAQGRRAGLASVAGVAAGNLGSAVATAGGLAAVLASSRLAFVLVAWLGALYLAMLGIGLLRRALTAEAAEARALSPEPGRGGSGRVAPLALDAPRAPVALRLLFRDGLVVALLNPKTALFFAAFLPQFIDASRPTLPQALVLGAGFVAIAACSDAVYAWGAGRLRDQLFRAGRRRGAAALVRATRIGQAAGGAALLLLGALGAWAGLRRAAT